MAIREVILTDVESEIWLEEFRFSARDKLKLEGSSDWSLVKRTLRGGPSANVDVITMDNGVLAVDVLPTRGMGLWKGMFRGKRLGWRSPVRFPIHPNLINVTSQQGTGWLRGFNEWMCRCGLESIGPASLTSGLGAPEERPSTLHGRIANVPAHFVSAKVDTAGKGQLTVRGIAEEAALFGGCLRLDASLHTEAGSNSLEISDTITNCSDTPSEVQLLYHINFGPPLLGEGSRLFSTIDQLAPYDEHSGRNSAGWDVCGPPTPGYVQQCFLVRPVVDAQGVAAILLCNSTADFAVQIAFDSRQLPCLTLWKYFAGEHDGYVLGIEPGTSYPNLKTVERQLGRVPVLSPGESLGTSVRLSFFDDSESIADIKAVLAERQAKRPPQIYRDLQQGFSFVERSVTETP